MVQGDRFEEVFAHIEENLFEPLSVRELSGVAGLSPFHFSRLFTVRTGYSVMAYVRTKRMMRAAQRLQVGEKINLVELAFDCGFESQEAFTRAFRRAIGMTPGRFKGDSAAYANGEKPMSAKSSVRHLDLVRLPGATRRDAFTVAGVADTFGPDTANAIPTLWPSLVERLPIPGQVTARTYGVCWPGDPKEGSFKYMAAVEVDPARAPADLEVVQIPAQTYLVFRLTTDGGEVHPQMKAAAQEIWGERLPQSGFRAKRGPDFEFYEEGFKAGEAGQIVDFYVPVEDEGR